MKSLRLFLLSLAVACTPLSCTPSHAEEQPIDYREQEGYIYLMRIAGQCDLYAILIPEAAYQFHLLAMEYRNEAYALYLPPFTPTL